MKKEALQRKIEEAMANNDKDGLRNLLEKENSLESIRKKLLSVKLTQQC